MREQIPIVLQCAHCHGHRHHLLVNSKVETELYPFPPSILSVAFQAGNKNREERTVHKRLNNATNSVPRTTNFISEK